MYCSLSRGVPEPHIATLLRISPGKLGVQPENFRAMVDELQKLGFRPQRRKFIVGIMVMGQLSSSTWKEKIHFYERFGWSEHEVLDAFMKHPRFMSASADKITRALDLLVNPMGCDPSVLIKWPQILTLNFERTLVPRCAFHHVLVSKGLVGPGSLLQMLSHLRSLSLESFELSCAEKDPQLLRLYVRKFLASRRSVIFSRMMESSDQKKK
ncbi:uncharacterized protein LOC130991681 [Salvia miltiorrhiza]|uniref:uncharacterized protein LOC130991681 n=1 Tax=Salvia miltiorrhiza TaxID=226208 RepID=UPI0025AB92F0|nr:uncharacterized protein LOC130991681 [Salvia miltiorrhiza]